MRYAGSQSADVANRLLTAEELYVRYGDRDFELVEGRPVPVTPTGPVHGRIDSRLGHRLREQVERLGLGEVYSNTGFILARSPDLLRGPDQAFVSSARIAKHPPPESGFWELVPELVIEVVSPNDSAELIEQKLSDYLAAGVSLIWIVYPRARRVHVFRPEQPTRIVSGDVSLDGEDVLPGVSIPLADVW